MNVTQIPDEEVSYKFAATLIFTNGICPYCKEQIYDIDGFNLKVDIEKGKRHYPKHGEEYRRNITILGL